MEQDSTSASGSDSGSRPGQHAPTAAQVHDGGLPTSLNVAKLRGEGSSGSSGTRYSSNEAVMSPTTSVKALLADTNAAPPPSASSFGSSSTGTSFEQQQAALRRRKATTAGSSSSADEDGPSRQLGADADSLAEDKASRRPVAPLIDGSNRPGASSPGNARPTFQQTLQDLRQFLLHFLKALPFKGLQNYLKKIIGPIVRLFVRGVAKILHRGQFGLASNLAFDVQLLIWKVRTKASSSRGVQCRRQY